MSVTDRPTVVNVLFLRDSVVPEGFPDCRLSLIHAASSTVGQPGPATAAAEAFGGFMTSETTGQPVSCSGVVVGKFTTPQLFLLCAEGSPCLRYCTAPHKGVVPVGP